MNRAASPALTRLFTAPRAADMLRNLGDALAVALIFGLLAGGLWVLAALGLTDAGMALVEVPA